MTTIWKFAVNNRGNQIAMPKDAKILTLQVQDHMPTIWALCDDGAPLEMRYFHVTGTGFDATQLAEGTYIGTWQTAGGLVWHLFEVQK